ncbi:flagellar basal body P-ring formation protein FlgA [Bermanella marisrubri]|uniref:Flagella basal body P-ring formation protein FlgA n=1 Tax=Bermanella marisrubri TaxID=207949 RepID=Q1N308_9GAMM|nr:flagellar basal body P-ring formation chaperone FlgA [Bermanella marisrubri]EAT12511.1 Flagellar basal body P-ring biosynthesis protein [Oceanobacter sp. RED65] [Bermanella marisrubri]QIZ84929.1 flagellar basal body P-ring formation protein FlgA [Bermanella marisrubri]
MRIGQIFGKHRFFLGLLCLVGVNSVSHATGDTGGTSWHQQIEQGLKGHLSHYLNQMAQDMEISDYQIEVDISYLDKRLEFAACPQPVQIETLTSLDLGRNHIKVACKTKSWALNVPVELNIKAPVVVLNQPVPKDIELQARHLDLEIHNLADLRSGYFLKKENVIGKQSKRGLAGQTVLNGRLVLPALLVKKGDRVIISASKGPMSVKMPGEALNDGREGRQIRVKNLRSERIIRATVEESGVVSVNF